MNPQLLSVVFCLLFLVSLSQAQDYPQFRGVGGKGVVKDAQIPSEWDPEKSLAWKVSVEGSGWSQPIVWKDKLFLTTAIPADGSKPKDFSGGVRNPASMGMGSRPPKFEVEWKVVCLDSTTGKVNWSTSVGKSQPKFGIHPSNSFATETPACDKNGVYAFLGPIGKVVGLSLDGKLKWERELGIFKTNNDFGTGSSLAIDTGKLFVQHLTEESADIHCIETETGKTVWDKKRDGSKGSSWSTPVVWENAQRKELIVSGGQQVNSYDLQSGDSLWTIKNVKAATACSICPDENQIYFGGSDPMSKGPLFAVSPGGSGEIQPEKTNETFETCAWRIPRSGPGMSTPVSNGDYVLTTDRSIAVAFRTKDGSKVFKERIPGISMVVGCPTVVGDEVFLVDEKGNMGAVKLSEEFQFRNLGSVKDVVWSTPAVSNDAIYVRGVEALYKFSLK